MFDADISRVTKPPPPPRQVQLDRGVTSIATRGGDQHFFIGTEAAKMYRFSSVDFKAELVSSSHSGAVRDVVISRCVDRFLTNRHRTPV